MRVTTADLGGLCEVKVVDGREDRSERARISDNAPHAHYALERQDIHIELESFKEVCDGLGVQEDWSVCEPFGGSGWHASIIQAMVKPRAHLVNDIAHDCTLSARMTLPESVEVVQGDGYDLVQSHERWDWVHADFNLWTLERMAGDAALRKAWLALFGAAEHCISFTDTTPYNNMKYAGRDIGLWFDEVDRWLQVLMGWKLEHVVCWGPAAMHVLHPCKEAFNGHGPVIQVVKEPMKVSILSVEE